MKECADQDQCGGVATYKTWKMSSRDSRNTALGPKRAKCLFMSKKVEYLGHRIALRALFR